MTLKELEKGKTAIIKSVGGDGALRQHFLDMGVIHSRETCSYGRPDGIQTPWI